MYGDYYSLWNDGDLLEADLLGTHTGSNISGHEWGDDSFVSTIFSNVASGGMWILVTPRVTIGNPNPAPVWTQMTMECEDPCGNGIIDPGEQCDIDAY